MKFIVNEMPYWSDDCPFYEADKCTLDNNHCAYLDPWTKYIEERGECPWLEEVKKNG